MKNRLALLVVALLSSPAQAGHEQPCYIDGCRPPGGWFAESRPC